MINNVSPCILLGTRRSYRMVVMEARAIHHSTIQITLKQGRIVFVHDAVNHFPAHCRVKPSTLSGKVLVQILMLLVVKSNAPTLMGR